MRKKIYFFCTTVILACVFLFSIPNKCEAQTFMGTLQKMWPRGEPQKSMDVPDGSTITIIVIDGWGGQKKVQGFVHFPNGNETQTSLLTVDRYDSKVISGTNGEYLPFSFESAVIFLDDKTLSICVVGMSYMGTITAVR